MLYSLPQRPSCALYKSLSLTPLKVKTNTYHSTPSPLCLYLNHIIIIKTIYKNTIFKYKKGKKQKILQFVYAKRT